MIGKTISHYRILEKLGEGGMGEVYKAEDTKLKRIVALKFLPAFLSSDEEAKKRFIHEAQSASALDHNNICTVYEVGETENNQLFISMACYEGETLKDKIQKRKLNIDEVVVISLQICEGLKKAHQNDITHRDIKPANIFVTNDGIVKILDFGLAKVKGQTKLTQMGSTAGTVDYMSPEQTRGEEVDQRTDIWAIGIVIHEMLTGESPFKGDYEQAVIYSILNSEPELGKVPGELEPVIKKAIAKSPEERYQHIEEMISDLISLKTGSKPKKDFTSIRLNYINTKTKLIAAFTLFIVAAAAIYFIIYNSANNQRTSNGNERKMIVVLPFENLGAAEDEYFAQGMREEISNKLAALGSIGVISRSSAEKFANTKKTAKEIGKELGVDYILEGTIQWAKSNGKVNRVRIFPQLVRVSDDINIWSDSYDRIINDIFELQNEIAQNVVDKLGIKILPAQFKNGAPPTRNLEAYDYYLKANQMKYRISSKADVYASIRLYEQAIALDSDFAAAHAQLAISYMGVYDRYYDRSNSIIKKMQNHLQKAVGLDSNLADVHLAKAFYYSMIKYDNDEALKEFNRTLEIQPSNAEVFMSLAVINWSRDNFDLDLKYSLKALALDPLSSRYALNVGNSYRWQRKYKNAEKYFNRAIELNPDFEDYYSSLISLYIDWKGSTKTAWAVFNKLKDKGSEGSERLSISLYIYGRNFKSAIKKLESLKTEYSDDEASYLPNSEMIALVYRYMKDYDLSKKYFEISIEQLKKKLHADSADFRIHNSLGICYAGLNNKEKALEQLRRGTNLNPSKEHTYFKFSEMIYSAEVYTLVGDYDSALKQIDTILSKPGYFSVSRLRITPLYDPLRDLPGYKSIINKYSAESE